MINIDVILDMLDWNQPDEIQKKGMMLASEIKCLDALLLPGGIYGKRVWENCAKVLSKKSDKELKPYLFSLFEWIEDLNWPGAIIICDRLNNYVHDEYFNYVYDECIYKAQALKSEMWLQYLTEEIHVNNK